MGELPLELQPKLLRVLQEGEVEPVGSSKNVEVDVRIIAATNRVLKHEMDEGRFRSDLYFRLNVFPLRIPPLRERKEDIPLLAQAFAERAVRKMKLNVVSIGETEYRALSAYPWPGNVRELENVIERALIGSRDGRLDLERALPQAASIPSKFTSDHIWSVHELRDLERQNIIRALEAGRGARFRRGRCCRASWDEALHAQLAYESTRRRTPPRELVTTREISRVDRRLESVFPYPSRLVCRRPRGTAFAEGRSQRRNVMTTKTMERKKTLNGIDTQFVRDTIAALEAEPAKAASTWRVATYWKGGTRSDTRVTSYDIGGERVVKDFTLHIDEPLELGGTNEYANPQEYLLGAMNACTHGAIRCRVRAFRCGARRALDRDRGRHRPAWVPRDRPVGASRV